MSDETTDNDPELDGLLAAASDGGEVSANDLDAMFGAIEARVRATKKSPIHWLRSRSTLVRQALAIASFGAIFGVIAASMPADDWAKLATAEVVLACLALLVLLVASLMVAVRPLHLPELPRGRLLALAIGSVAATFVLAVTVHGPGGDAHAADSLWAGATPCMYFGLLVGIPVYGMARLLDRGTYLGPLLAAAAAGLTGNFMLQMRCPISDPMHNLAGHASVALIFVGGILLLESVLRRRRR